MLNITKKLVLSIAKCIEIIIINIVLNTVN